MSVVVMGLGFCGASNISAGLSYREMIAKAATMAYEEAGVTAGQIEAAVSCEEDFYSGYSIADEYVPDQLGVVRKSVYTICGDFIQGVCSAVMQLNAGQHKLLVVESYCKASNVLTKDDVLHFAYDPIFGRLGLSPHYQAGLEMQRFLDESSYTMDDVAKVAVDNRRKAMSSLIAPYGARINAKDVLNARPVAEPVTEAMFPKHADAAVVAVLAVEEVAMETAKNPVFISGTGWSSGNSVPERRTPSVSEGTELAAKMAYEEAGINSYDEIDAFYVSDLYAHRQLMHLDALKIPADIGPALNPDGGALGGGDLLEATGGARFYDAVRQLQGTAGPNQIPGAETALVHSWRGVPTDSCAVVILDGEGSE